jgi:Family of unknown function (DUF695)
MTQSETRVIVPEPHYTMFNAKRSGKAEVVVINDSLLSFVHTDIFPWHLRVIMQATDLIDNGMPSPEESEILFSIGDEIEKVVDHGRTEHNSQNALFLARSTWDGIRELLFQVHDPEVAHVALQALLQSRVWARKWNYKMENDPQWSVAAHLFQLFPQARGNNT